MARRKKVVEPPQETSEISALPHGKEKWEKMREAYRYYRLVLGMKRKPAAIRAGFSYKTAVKQSFKFDRLYLGNILGLQVPDALEIAGMDNVEYANRLISKTEAKKIQNCRLLIRRDADGTPKVEQNADDFIEVDDNQTQMRALELIGEWKKLASAKAFGINGASGPGNAVQININIDGAPTPGEYHADAEARCSVSVAA